MISFVQRNTPAQETRARQLHLSVSHRCFDCIIDEKVRPLRFFFFFEVPPADDANRRRTVKFLPKAGHSAVYLFLFHTHRLAGHPSSFDLHIAQKAFARLAERRSSGNSVCLYTQTHINIYTFPHMCVGKQLGYTISGNTR